ncbi:hypothetical protein [Gloeobacter violaceus]|uniref:Glr1878 protein n=1 Tax=Gloeobacter violaceus (strain ATCC 29082 / PCC 7421) TaxID=251221 RepID=Q7NJF4_GLOVI|nr:hypothetical protein [Gloeobacter violaceus]BAC89819.1 glr1878 [Gloeobacter violaceus PCC 7421]
MDTFLYSASLVAMASLGSAHGLAPDSAEVFPFLQPAAAPEVVLLVKDRGKDRERSAGRAAPRFDNRPRFEAGPPGRAPGSPLRGGRSPDERSKPPKRERKIFYF